MDYTYIPSFYQCNTIVNNNISFISKTEILDNKYSVTSFGYRLATVDDFIVRGTRNMRGIIFNNDTGDLLALPLHKFWNYNENEYTEYNKIKDKKIVRVTEKYDGSLIYFFMIDENLYAKTKMNCFSDQAIWAMNLVNNNKKLYNSIVEMIKCNYTPMFEFISPRNRIVIDYKKEELKYICSRNMSTGEYLYGNIDGASSIESISVNNIDEILNIIKDFEKNEGFVIVFNDGDMLKIKTEDYFRLHKLRSSVLSDNILAYNILNENIDDLKSMLSTNDTVLLEHVNNFEKKILNVFNDYIDKAAVFYTNHSFLNRKEYAIKAQKLFDGVIFGLTMEYYQYGSVNIDRLKEKFLQKRLWEE